MLFLTFYLQEQFMNNQLKALLKLVKKRTKVTPYLGFLFMPFFVDFSITFNFSSCTRDQIN